MTELRDSLFALNCSGKRIMETKLTVCFDDPFWVGVFERMDDGKGH